jgi:DNA-binding NarL/FixJ family response regulator
MTTSRVLVADESPPMRHWIGAALAPLSPMIQEVGNGWQLMWHLAEEGPYHLVVAEARLGGVSGAQALAMSRTAGLSTPFLLIAPFCKDSVRALVARVGVAAVIEDALDANSVLRTARDLLAGRPVERGLAAARSRLARRRPLRAARVRRRERQARD